jgi:N-acyl-D-amino-acid deacylase
MDRQGGPDGLQIMDFPDKSLVGKMIGQVARERKEDPVDTAIWLQMNGFDRPGGVQFRAFAVSLLEIEEFMKKDYTAVCTDRDGDSPELRKNPFVHPGTFGTVPRKLRTFVFDRNVVTLPFAIRSMTSLSAQILGLRDRGRLAEGLKADIVVFDPATIKDKATFQSPFVFSEGINFVLVNGGFVVDRGKPTTARPGKVLERQRPAKTPALMTALLQRAVY